MTQTSSESKDFVYSDRVSRCRGGVGVLVKDDFPASEVTIDGDNRLLELLWIKVKLHSRTMYVGALYHPPHPIYATSLLTARLEHTVEVLVHSDPEALLVLGGDLNELGDSTVVEATGLIPLVHQPTRG